MLDPLEAVKHSKREDGLYCTISGNKPSSVTLYKTGSESQTFSLQFQEFKAIHFSWLGPELLVCYLAHRGPTGVFLLLRS